MEAARRKQIARLVGAVIAAPQRFEFRQAVRLLERGLAQMDAEQGGEPRRPIGLDHAPETESVRLRASASLAFPQSTLREPQRAQTGANGGGPMELQAQFFGLVGAVGVLPMHYSELVLRREQLKDTTLRDFLDLLHHRCLSLFYRASRKYSLGLAFEHSRLFGEGLDDFTAALQSFAGLPATKPASGLAEHARVQFAGLFQDPRRSQSALEGMLSELLGAPATVRPFIGRWLHFDAGDVSRLRARPVGDGLSQRLGQGFVLGEKVWDVASRIAIRIGPIDRRTLRSLRPGGRILGQLARLVRDFVDDRCDAVLECVVRPDQATPIVLGARGLDGSGLGWDSWLLARPATEPAVVSLPFVVR